MLGTFLEVRGDHIKTPQTPKKSRAQTVDQLLPLTLNSMCLAGAGGGGRSHGEIPWAGGPALRPHTHAHCEYTTITLH